MKLEESQKQRSQQDPGHVDEPPPPYDPDKDQSLAQDSDSDSYADLDLDSDAKSNKPLPDWQTGRYDMGIVFLQKLNIQDLRDVDWEAQLHVHAKDVLRLMKEGFYWTEANVRKQEGYFILEQKNLPAFARACEWTCSRIYHLTDMAKDGNPQWIADLRVYARKRSVLSAFRVRHLSVDKIHQAFAFNRKGQVIYEFSKSSPEQNVNAIYNDRPLEGWWPWPKKSQGLEK
ncbi:Uncharacterized protein TCAP_05892 [Tolypocladium capitatum]|uniref:Uncharacterized protein n=1 Tax=Tolypocladium capitatum TaxID=45235 RepID=A0A2K3Q9E4_9HYPO|nr:Uncharacterized protein TCAP_05892 [Tolypocladium capitatum]